jgi:hypothetical protein
MAGWETIQALWNAEIQQLKEEGVNVPFDALQNPPKTDAAWETRHADIIAKGHAIQGFHSEPNDLCSILAEFRLLLPVSPKPSFAQFHGAMMGRAIGCALGKPLEAGPYFWESTPTNPGWKNIKKWFVGANSYPIRDYVPAHSLAQNEGLYVICPESQKEHIRYMESDDDIRYTMLALVALERYGSKFTAYEIGKLWHEMLPYQFVCTAETQAYLNFAKVTHHLTGKKPADFETASLPFVRTHQNPYREWIGAQIRIDGYAYAAAGNPLLAARLAYHDASLSHVKNGIYGAMFFAALISTAFVSQDIDACIEQALLVIPSTSRLHRYLVMTWKLAKQATSQEALIEAVWEYLLDYPPAHTINNACICLASIVFGKGDFDISVTTAVLFGLDTDCNGATVGSFVGARNGIDGIAMHWIEPLNDTIYAKLPDFHPISIAAVAQRFFACHVRIAEASKQEV